MLAEGLFVKALQNLETGELLNNSLCGKLVSSLVSQKHLMKFSVTSVSRFQFIKLRFRQLYV